MFYGHLLQLSGGHIGFFWEIERGLVPLAPLATPMVRVKMYVSITNTEGVMPILMISRSRGRHIGLIFFFKIEKEPGPPNIYD